MISIKQFSLEIKTSNNNLLTHENAFAFMLAVNNIAKNSLLPSSAKKNGSLLKKSYEFGKVNSKSKLTSLKKSSIVSTLRIHEVLSLMFLREEF